MANFMGMALARDIHLGRLLGQGRAPRGAMLEGVRVYTSDQTHFSIGRALDLLGFPPETLVVHPVRRPLPPAGRAGRPGDRPRPRRRSDALRDRCRRRVDEHRLGRRGRRARRRRRGRGPLVPRGCGVRRRRAPVGARPRTRAGSLERADSVTVDPHKWFFQSYDIGGLLVREASHLAETFGGRSPEYYRGGEAPAARAPTTTTTRLNFYKLSFEGTRRWRALKLWMSWKHLGTSGFGRLIEDNDDLAALPRAVAAPRPTTSRPSRRPRSCRSSASAIFRVVAAAARASDPASSMPTRIGSRPRSRPPATAGSRRRACAARRFSARESSTTSPPRRTSTGCSRRSAASPGADAN